MLTRCPFCNHLRRKLANTRLVRWVWSDRYLLIYTCTSKDALPTLSDDHLHCNQLDDLTLFEQTEKWLPRELFLEEARRRIAEGMRLYTLVDEKKLVHYSWLIPRQERAWFPYVHQNYDFPKGAAVMFNAYTHPGARGTGLHVRSMRRRIADATAAPGTTAVYTAIEFHNAASRAVAAKVGFKCADVLFETIRFGRTRRGRMTPAMYFSTVECRS